MPSPERTNKLSQLSLYYLVGYLYFGGVGLLVSPGLALKLLLSTGDYGVVMPRMAGLLMLGLGTIVLQIIRHEIHSLYSTAIVVRALFCVAMIWFYTLSGDRLFLVLLGIIGTGVILTASGYALDRRQSTRTAAPAPSFPRSS